MYKKINLYINKEYICSSNRYKTCKEFKNKVLKDGYVQWQCLNEVKTKLILNDDKIICSFK